jgi:hypothetical protein
MTNSLKSNMRFVVAAGGLAVVLAGCVSYGESAKPMMSKDVKSSHLHMGHVLTAMKGTPGGTGLLAAAEAEIAIAVQHAGFAVSKPGNLASIKTHTGHVLHTIAPKIETKGPGKGYGVKRAAAGVTKHIGFASSPAGASKNVKLHSTHVATSAINVLVWADEVIALAKKMLALTKAMRDGTDANGDGKITWVNGEGGLKDARKHMGFMAKGEGLAAKSSRTDGRY